MVEILFQSDKALTASGIYNQAHKHYPSLGLVSVYLALKRLELLGLIQKVHQKDRCQANIALSNWHEHLLVCASCGKVSFFHGDDLDNLVNGVEEETGYLIQEHWLQLLGKCEECKNK